MDEAGFGLIGVNSVQNQADFPISNSRIPDQRPGIRAARLLSRTLLACERGYIAPGKGLFISAFHKSYHIAEVVNE